MDLIIVLGIGVVMIVAPIGIGITIIYSDKYSRHD
jgi:hypothetical protein